MGPLVNLTLGVLALGLLYLLCRPRDGWVWQWFGQRVDSERVQIEDALKHLFHRGEAGEPGTVESVAAALQITGDLAARVAQQLERRALVVARGTSLQLTEDGRLYALQVIRTHRLWEHYLAQETGVAEKDWHTRAERAEHQLTPAEADALAARLGHPAFDPHGDPIPTSSGKLQHLEGDLLSTVRAGCVVRVVHVEDEPESTYRELRAALVEPGMVVRVLASSADGVRVDTGVSPCELSPLAAANVTVRPLPDEAADNLRVRRLSSLAAGQQAVVASISPACRGVERRRLLDLGLVPGTKVTAEFASPAGDPMAYRVRGALIALRHQQADMICVEP
jgi:DtxR family Mn-dependent transcriptional regulator